MRFGEIWDSMMEGACLLATSYCAIATIIWNDMDFVMIGILCIGVAIYLRLHRKLK